MYKRPSTQSPAPIPTPPFPLFGKLASYYARLTSWGKELAAMVTSLQAQVTELFAAVQKYQQENQALRDENARLKGQKPKPVFKGSALDKRTGDGKTDDDDPEGPAAPGGGDGRRPGSDKRSKTATLKVHHEVVARLNNVPAGAVFNGYSDYVVQDVVVMSSNTRIRREEWRLPGGKVVLAPMPVEFSFGHFGLGVHKLIIGLHRKGHVSQEVVRELMLDWGVDISEGQVNAILNNGHEDFFKESVEVLQAGLLHSPVITVDDTGVRHQGVNGYATNISGPRFAWFRSAETKTRLNFLELLHAGAVRYELNEDAAHYMAHCGSLPPLLVANLRDKRCEGDLDWLNRFLDQHGVVSQDHRATLTEAALWGGLTRKRHPALALVSDGAKQFVVGLHGLCWVHTERLFVKLIAGSDEQDQHRERVRKQIWALYAKLKAYKVNPVGAAALRQEFDDVFGQPATGFAALDAQLARTLALKDELLLVLERPDVPLHTNQSETDIRDYVKVRKISGGTRSDDGRRCRDAFTSLVKTCRKNGVSFWDYLHDRLTHAGAVPRLAELIRLNTPALPA